MTFLEWLEVGITSGFCAEPECDTHGGVPLTEEERQEFEDGGDPCITVTRLWGDGELARPGPWVPAPEVGGPHIVPQEP